MPQEKKCIFFGRIYLLWVCAQHTHFMLIIFSYENGYWIEAIPSNSIHPNGNYFFFFFFLMAKYSLGINEKIYEIESRRLFKHLRYFCYRYGIGGRLKRKLIALNYMRVSPSLTKQLFSC